jgi:hypothetical protein
MNYSAYWFVHEEVESVVRTYTTHIHTYVRTQTLTRSLVHTYVDNRMYDHDFTTQIDTLVYSYIHT